MAERDVWNELFRSLSDRGGETELWVAGPDDRSAPAQPGIQTSRESGTRWPTESVGVYVIASEYLVPYFRNKGEACEPADLSSLLSQLTVAHPRDDMLQALAGLNQISRRVDLAEAFRRHLATEIDADLALSLNDAMDSPAGHPRRVLLARPCILRAMRWVAEHAPPGQPPNGPALQPASLARAMLLVHLVAEGMGARIKSGRDTRVGGLTESLALELVCNGLSTRRDNEGSMLARTRLLYEHYGARLRRALPRAAPLLMVEEALGMPFDHALAVGFAYYAAAEDNDPLRAPPLFPAQLGGSRMPPTSWHQFLAVYGQTSDEFSARAAVARADWQMGSLQARPLLIMGEDVLVLDEDYLIEAITRGLYWLVHDHEKKRYGDKARNLWTQVHGEMHELLVESYLEALAPRALSDMRLVFDEDDLGEAFPNTKRADIGVDFGTTVLIADAQGGQVSTRTREQADPEAFVADMERLVLGKVDQLEATARNLLRSPQPSGSPLQRPAPHITPAVVTAGLFAQNPVVREHINSEILRRGLLQHPRVAPLAVLDLRDLEHAAVVIAEHGVTLIDLLSEWRGSDSSDTSLSDWLAGGVYSTTPGVRLPELSEALERTFDSILSLVPGEE
jgi:hypothetical protein